MVAQLIRSVEAEHFKQDVPYFGPGDTVRVHAKVVEGTRERIQVFEGVVIRRRAGGINENFTVRRIASHGIGVERTFLIHSPRIDRIEVMRHGRVRRAKLYYLRELTGKAARIKERRRPAHSQLRRGSSAVVANGVADVTEVEEMVVAPIGADEIETTQVDAVDAAETVEDTAAPDTASTEPETEASRNE